MMFVGWFGPEHLGESPQIPEGWTFLGIVQGGHIAWIDDKTMPQVSEETPNMNCVMWPVQR